MGDPAMLGLGLDGGGSATRWALWGAGGKVAEGELPAVTGYLFNAPDRARFAGIAAALGRAVAPWNGSLGEIGHVVAGITGLSAGTEAGDIAARLLADAAGVDVARVHVEDDVWIAFHAAFAPGEGHVVYAGTGSVGLHVRADGSAVRVGGRGMLIDDAGSAFAIGRAALSHVFRRLDETPGCRSTLAEAIFAAVGGSDWGTVRAHAYGGGERSPRDAIAQLARVVAAAARDGDAAALAILTEAGDELGRLATLLARREGDRPVALLGRAATLHPAIAAAARARAAPLDLALRTIDAAAAAARLARLRPAPSRPAPSRPASPQA